MHANKPVGVDSGELAKKVKKSGNFAVYDILKAAHINRNPLPPAIGILPQTRGFHSNAARWNEILVPKSFVMKKKRKKRLSTFKKKILMVNISNESMSLPIPYAHLLFSHPIKTTPGKIACKYQGKTGNFTCPNIYLR
jgi:hypothetical protein